MANDRPVRPVLTIRELSELLPPADGRPLSRQRLYSLLQAGRIPGGLKIGRRVLVRRTAIERWLAGEENGNAADR
jgi:excisionase family DNA binding protein